MINNKILISILLFLLIGCSKSIPKIEKNNITIANDIILNKKDINGKLNFNNQKWWNIYEDENLNRIMEITLKSNTDLKIASLNIEKTKNKMILAKNKIESSINANALTMSTIENTTTPKIIAGDNINIALATLDFSYKFDFFNKYSNLVKQQKFLIESNELYSDLVQLNISTSIANLYGYYIYLNNQNELFNNELKLLNSLKTNVQSDIDNGMTNHDKLLILKNDIHKVSGQRNLNLAEISTTKETINLLSAYKHEKEINALLKESLSNKEILKRSLIIPNKISSDVISNRPDVKYYLSVINSQEAKLESLKADFYPQFAIGGNVGYAGLGINNPYQNIKATIWSLGPKVFLPVFDLENIKKNYEIGGLDLNIFIENYNKTINTAYSNVEVALTNSKVAKINVLESDESLKNSFLILDHSNTNYKIGSISRNENLIDQLTYVYSQFKNENERYKLYSNQIILINSLGGVYQK